jgi:hypothetical protein
MLLGCHAVPVIRLLLVRRRPTSRCFKLQLFEYVAAVVKIAV